MAKKNFKPQVHYYSLILGSRSSLMLNMIGITCNWRIRIRIRMQLIQGVATLQPFASVNKAAGEAFSPQK